MIAYASGKSLLHLASSNALLRTLHTSYSAQPHASTYGGGTASFSRTLMWDRGTTQQGRD